MHDMLKALALQVLERKNQEVSRYHLAFLKTQLS